MPGQPGSEVLVPKIKKFDDEGKLPIEAFLIVPGWIEVDPVWLERESVGDFQEPGILW
jgi:hypothetical protein